MSQAHSLFLARSEHLPEGASVSPDGSVTLALIDPVSLLPTPSNAVQTEISKLTFRRMTGAEYRTIAKGHNKFVAALKLSLVLRRETAFHLYRSLQIADFAAVTDVIAWLLPRRDVVPERAAPQADGGYKLPLLRPVSDGNNAVSLLQLRPLTWEEIHTAGRPDRERFMANAVHHSTGLPLWVASKIVEGSDAADYAALEAIIAELLEKSVGSMKSRFQNKRV